MKQLATKPFFFELNVGGINAFVIWKANNMAVIENDKV